MKSTLGKSVAQHIIAENERQKTEIINLRRDLKKIEDKMMQALDRLSVTYSSRLKSCQKLLLFDSPYQCLSAFVQEMGKTATFSIETAQENQNLVDKNRKLQYRIESIENQLKQRKLKQQQTIDELNKQINTKKSQLNKLQQDYQQVLKAKKVAQKQLGDTKQHMKILRLKLYQQQREKLTEIIVANKKEMIDFRRSMQMQAYKQELQYKKNMDEKDIEIRTLTQNIQELINNKLTHLSDLTVLEKIVQPMRDTTMLKAEIVHLKKQTGEMKQEIREKHAVILGLQGKVADVTMSRDNLISYNQRLVIQKNLLTQELKQTKAQLQKAISDRQALDLYYSQKWHTQFSKVKGNLQQKFTRKFKQLQRQFEKKRKQVQAQILAHVERLRVMKGQLGQVKKRNEDLVGVNVRLQNDIGQMKGKNLELQRAIEQSDKFHHQQLRMFAYQLGQKLSSLTQTNHNLTTKNRQLQFQLHKSLTQIEISQKSYLRQKFQQIQQINFQHRRQIQKLKKQHKREIQLLQKSYGNMKQLIEQARLQERRKFQVKQKQIVDSHSQKLKQVQVQCQSRVKKINEKLSQSESRYQKLRRVKQQQLQYANNKLIEVDNVLHERQKQIISRDVQLQEYKKMREMYMGEIARVNSLMNEEVFLKESMKVQLQAVMKKVDDKQKTILQLQSRKHLFKQQLQEFQKLYKKQFAQLQQTHKKINAINKRKIKQLQALFQQRPIKQQHFQKIKSLQKTNSQLRTQIHLKQAENLILSEVKDYYQQRAFYGNNGNQNYAHIKTQVMENATKQQLLSTCNFLKTSNSFMRPTTNQGGSSIVKKYRSRKNKLITSSYNKFDAFQEEEKGGKQDSTEVTRMRRYLMKQHCRGGIVSEFKKVQEVPKFQRTKSSLG